MLDLILAVDVTDYNIWRIVGIVVTLVLAGLVFLVSFLAYRKTLKMELEAAKLYEPVEIPDSSTESYGDEGQTSTAVVSETVEVNDVVEPVQEVFTDPVEIEATIEKVPPILDEPTIEAEPKIAAVSPDPIMEEDTQKIEAEVEEPKVIEVVSESVVVEGAVVIKKKSRSTSKKSEKKSASNETEE